MTTTLHDQFSSTMRHLVALQLLREGAVQVNLQRPFELVSGNYSPIYVNCRRLISSVSFADLFGSYARFLADHMGLRFDIVAGGETAGIPFAAFLARSFARPMVYVRKTPKSYGAGGLVEGVVLPKQRALLVEDLITDAGSKVGFINSLRAADAVVEDVMVILDRLQGGGAALADASVRLYAMADINDVLQAARTASVLSPAEIDEVRAYSVSASVAPRHGLAFKER